MKEKSARVRSEKRTSGPTAWEGGPLVVDEETAARLLGVSTSTLRKQRMNGERDSHMPVVPFVRAGRIVRYRLCDLHDWLERHVVRPEAPEAA